MAEKAIRLRLKGVVQCSFVRSEASNLDIYRKVPHYPGDIGKGEAFLFLSKGGDQVLFLFADQQVDFKGVPRRVIDSRRLRLEKGSWNPYMLQNYANSVGLHLEGIKRFEQVYKEQQERKKGGR